MMILPDVGIIIEIIGFMIFLPMGSNTILHLDYFFEINRFWKMYEKSNPPHKQTKKQFFLRSYKYKMIELLTYTDIYYSKRITKLHSKEFAQQLLRFGSIGLIIGGLFLQFSWL